MPNLQYPGKPRVSVIIPSYNYGHFIGAALESLRGQSFTDWECWIIDDGSTDDTQQIVAEIAALDARVKYFYQCNQGQPAARNAGLERAGGEYIQFLDADDRLAPDKFQRQSCYLDRFGNVDIVYGDVRYFECGAPSVLFMNRWGNRMEEWMPKISGKGRVMTGAFVSGNIFELGCALFRRSAIDTIGLFNTELPGVEDHDYCFRGALLGCWYDYTGQEGTEVLMRHHADSYSKGRLIMFKNELLLRMLMDTSLKRAGLGKLRRINKLHFSRRLRRLQDLIIGQALKDRRANLKETQLQWIYRHSTVGQNLYFMVRFFKALILSPLR